VCVASKSASAKANNREDMEDHQELINYLAEHYEPNTVVLLKTEKNEKELSKIADYVADYHTINDKTTYYVCENHNCQTPINDLA